jgi:hypothetical protein
MKSEIDYGVVEDTTREGEEPECVEGQEEDI